MLKNLFFGAIAVLISNCAHAQQVPIVVKDIKANGDADISEIATCNGNLFFTANDGTGLSAWITDGTAGNTISLQTNGGRDYNEYNGKTYFIAKNNSNHEQLWVTDGTPAGTSQVVEINNQTNGVIDIYTVANNKLFLRGVDSLHGSELWATDGTIAGTELMGDVNHDTASGIFGGYNSYGVYNNRLFYVAHNGVDGLELWSSDGTPGGASMYQDINNGAGNSNPTNFSVINGKLYYTATNYWGRELWVLDDATGTTAVQNLAYSNTSSNPGPLLQFNNKMYFLGGPSAPAIQNLYLTDGTSAGTVKLVDSVSNMTTFSGHIYYGKSIGALPGQGQGLHYALYKTVGDIGSPQLFVSDLIGGNSYTAPRDFTVCDGKLYFLQIHDGLAGVEHFTVNDLWMHDPATNTADLIMSAANQANAAFIFTNTGITAYNNNIFFKGKEGEGEELYKLGAYILGIEDAKQPSNFIIYPNPANNTVAVRSSSAAMLQQISITDIKGQVLYENMDANATIQSIDLSDIPAGMYMIKVRDSQGVQGIKRFVKQ